MKYKTEGLFMGFAMSWFISVTAIINNHPIKNVDIYMVFPFLMWGIWSLMDHITQKE